MRLVPIQLDAVIEDHVVMGKLVFLVIGERPVDETVATPGKTAVVIEGIVMVDAAHQLAIEPIHRPAVTGNTIGNVLPVE
ncbi:hypothetical protein D9M71_736410 [compost metagenome]